MPIRIGELVADVTVQRQPSSETSQTASPAQQQIDPHGLADRVYRLMRQELTIARERE